MAGAAVLAERDFGDAADSTGFDLRQPEPTARDRRDKPRTVVRSDRLAGGLVASPILVRTKAVVSATMPSIAASASLTVRSSACE
jgi:hypothetical protein